MKKNINYTFLAQNFGQVLDNIASFDILASKSNTMTSHDITFKNGAFKKAIDNLKNRRKMLPMFFNHNPDYIIGGFPVDQITEKSGNLKMKAKLNLDIVKANEIYSLIKQNVLTDVSVGVTLDPTKMSYNKEKNIMEVKEVNELYETSVVWSGSNPAAVITNFNVTAYSDLPIADEKTVWDKEQAIKRVKKFTNSNDKPTEKYKEAFMWFDGENFDNFNAYKLPFADVINGKLTAVPKALESIVSAINGSMENVKIPVNDEEKIKRNINRYYNKMSKDKIFAIKYIEEYNINDCEKLLINSKLSRSEAKTFISLIKNDGKRDVAISKADLKKDQIKKLLGTLNRQNLEINICRLKQTLQI